MTESIEECNCALCVATRQACNDHGITNRIARQHFRDLVEVQADMCDVMAKAEDEGYDLDGPEYEAAMDQIFSDPVDKSKMN